MATKNMGLAVILLTVGSIIFSSVYLTLSINEQEIFRFLVRAFGLYGFLFICFSVLTTPFLKEITQMFGKPFIFIHHLLSLFGVVFITLHPIFNAVDSLSLSVFIPRFSSWSIFWILAGRPAFILMYIALVSAFLRKKMIKYWRYFHGLMYVVLFFGIIHANLIGTDFEYLGIKVLFNTLFIFTIGAFIIKRYRTFKIKKELQRRKIRDK